MAFTNEEKVAGRVFRAQQQDALLEAFEANPPDHQAPNFLAIFRHNCKARQGRSTALELKEVYVHSPSYVVFNDASGAVAKEGDKTWADEHVPSGEPYTVVPAERFGFAYKRGKCKGCGATALSKAGRLVDPEDRPPLHGRVAR